jgi:hypothetical protein
MVEIWFIELYGVYDKLSDFLLLESAHIRTYPAREARKPRLLSLLGKRRNMSKP